MSVLRTNGPLVVVVVVVFNGKLKKFFSVVLPRDQENPYRCSFTFEVLLNVVSNKLTLL